VIYILCTEHQLQQENMPVHVYHFNNSYKPITNTAWVCDLLGKLQKKVHSKNDKVYQLLAHGWRFSLGTPASSTTKTGLAIKRHVGVRENPK
jgi:hypothetical protein